MSGIFQILPLTIPDAAGINNNEGDVRHLSTTDELAAVNISNVTRMLAYRDAAVRDKVNEVVDLVNNREQYVDVPIMRTTLPPGASETVHNFRIPIGFEARVLNAIVASSPIELGQLSILYSADTFGATTGTSPITTFSEFSGGTQFFSAGELIIQLGNVGAVTGDITASVLLTIRPIGANAGGVISPGTTGPQGKQGIQGPQGEQGIQGLPGNPGSPGLIPRGTWSPSINNYVVGSVVKYNGAVYVATTNVTQTTPPSVDTLEWELLLPQGATGAAGSNGVNGTNGSTGTNGSNGLNFYYGTGVPSNTFGVNGETYTDSTTFLLYNKAGGVWTNVGSLKGAQGNVGINIKGTYNPISSYNPNDVVTVYTVSGTLSSGTRANTYIASATTFPGAVPGTSSGTNWTELFGPTPTSVVPTLYQKVPVSAQLQFQSSYAAGTSSGIFFNGGVAGGTLALVMEEFSVISDASNTTSPSRGISTLVSTIFANFNGAVRILLPTPSLGGSVTAWTTVNTNCIINNYGAAGANAPMISQDGVSWIISNTVASPTEISITGNERISF